MLTNITRREQHFAHLITTAPATEPLTNTELKTHLRITDTSEDSYLDQLITDARYEFEDLTGLALIDQSWRLLLDHWPSFRDPWWDGLRVSHINEVHGGTFIGVELPRYPLTSVDTITVYDEDSNATAVTIADVFDVDTSSHPGRLVLQSGATWPVALRRSNAIQIDYSAGYGSAASDVPEPIRRALRLMASYMYEHRGDCSGADAFANSGAMAIARRYGRVKI